MGQTELRQHLGKLIEQHILPVAREMPPEASAYFSFDGSALTVHLERSAPAGRHDWPVASRNGFTPAGADDPDEPDDPPVTADEVSACAPDIMIFLRQSADRCWSDIIRGVSSKGHDKRTVARWLKKLQAQGWVEHHGRGTPYRLISTN
jgi:hypothetical protein